MDRILTHSRLALAGLDLLLLQMSPQYEEMDRFAAQVIAPSTGLAARA